LKILLLELAPLVEQDGVYYAVYNSIVVIDDFTKQSLGDDEVRVVIFFDDPKIDLMAEKLKVKTRLKNFDCQLPFKNFARNMFD